MSICLLAAAAKLNMDIKWTREIYGQQQMRYLMHILCAHAVSGLMQNFRNLKTKFCWMQRTGWHNNKGRVVLATFLAMDERYTVVNKVHACFVIMMGELLMRV